MDSYRIVPYDADHKALVAQLARHLWSPDLRLNASYLDWKYHRNPYIREPLIYLAYSGDEVVGMRGAFGSKWEAGHPSERFVLPYADDLVVDPSHRVKGLHRRIMEFALDDLRRRGHRYVVNFSASQVTALGSLRMKWRSAGSFKPVLRRTRYRKAIDRLASRINRWPFVWRWSHAIETVCNPPEDRLFDRLDARLSKREGARQSSSLFVEAVPLVQEMTDLVARLPGDQRMRHVRDSDYFAWRYSNPLNTYRFVYAAGERLEGYLVLRRSRAGIRNRVCIVEWEAQSDRAREELLAAAVTCGYFPDLYAWTATMPPSAGAMYERYGFEPAHLRYETSLLVRSLQEDELNKKWMLGGLRLDDVQSWNLRMIDSMQG